MKTKRQLGQLLFGAAIIVSIIACGGGNVVPTDTPPPPPTNTPLPPPPTNTPLPPPPTDTPLPPPTATQPASGGESERIPGQLNIIQVAGYQDSFEDWNIIGLIANDTDRIMEDIQVEVEIFDANNVSIYKNSDSTTVSLYTLGPGEITPFHLGITEDLAAPDHFVATIVGSNVSSAERGKAEVSQVNKFVDDNDNVYLVGEITNTDSKPILVSGVAAATFDANGEMISAASENVSLHYLDPGETGPFRINLTGAEGSAASVTDFNIYTDVQVYDQQPSYNLEMSDLYDYKDSYDDIHLVGEVTNNEDKPLNVSVVVAIYDGQGNIMDACSASLPFYATSGEKVPFDCSYWGPLNWIPSAYDTAEKYKTFIDRYWTYQSYSEEVVVSTSEDKVEYSSGRGTFTGKVVNNTPGKLDSATVAVSVYNKDGILVAAAWDYIFDEIQANASADYEVYVYLPDGFDPATGKIVITAKGSLP